MINNICVIGAGTMGSGIALVAAQSSIAAILFDVKETMLDKASAGIQNSLNLLVEKQKISPQQAIDILNNIHFTSNINHCKASVIIEAIVEQVAAKVELFNQLATINTPQSIFASNTSSLSISDIQLSITNPERFVGMHFFNPAPIMKLVEVVKGQQTSDVVAQEIYDLCITMKKTPVLCKDAPGFIVNRVARHYYLEAMKLVEQGVASIEEIDAIMEASGFKMGPFKLMDLIGLDINLSVSQSLYNAFEKAERFRPSPIQINKVLKGELGKKSGKGFYNYTSL